MKKLFFLFSFFLLSFGFLAAQCQYPIFSHEECGEVELRVNNVGQDPVFQWSTGESSATITVTENSIYSVTVTSTVNGASCTAESSIHVVIHGADVVISSTSECTEADLVATAAGVPPFTYQWSTGSNWSFVQVSSPGTYSVTVTDANGCEASDIFQFTGFETSFEYDITEGNVFIFITQDVQIPSSTNSIIWNFGDGSIVEDLLYPSHLYSEPGEYWVTLTAFSCECGSSSYSELVVIEEVDCIPEPIFSMSEGDDGYVYVFVNNQDSETEYIWNFGDGNTFTGTNTGHTYSASGTYVITLTAMNECGVGTHSENVYIEVSSGCNTSGIRLSNGVMNEGEFCFETTQIFLIAPPGAYGCDWNGPTYGSNTQLLASTDFGTHYYQLSCYINGVQKYFCFEYTVLDCTTGLSELEDEAEFVAFPNPTSGFVTLEGVENEEQVQIVNSLGQMFVQEYWGRIDLEDFPAGIYFLLTPEGKSFKVIKE